MIELALDSRCRLIVRGVGSDRLRSMVRDWMVAEGFCTLPAAQFRSVAMESADVVEMFFEILREKRETELSVVGCNQQSGSDFYQVFGFATATARLAALNPVPQSPIHQRSG